MRKMIARDHLAQAVHDFGIAVKIRKRHAKKEIYHRVDLERGCSQPRMKRFGVSVAPARKAQGPSTAPGMTVSRSRLGLPAEMGFLHAGERQPARENIQNLLVSLFRGSASIDDYH